MLLRTLSLGDLLPSLTRLLPLDGLLEGLEGLLEVVELPLSVRISRSILSDLFGTGLSISRRDQGASGVHHLGHAGHPLREEGGVFQVA